MREEIHVHRLTLEARTHELLTRGNGVLAEAFRLAEVPGQGLPGKLLIRHFDVGSFSESLPVSRLASQITQGLRLHAADAVVFTSPLASSANAVRIDTPLQPFVELVRWACGSQLVDLSAWFWPRLVHGVGTWTTAVEAQRIAVRHLLRVPNSLFVMAALLDVLVSEARAERFFEQWSVEHDLEIGTSAQSGEAKAFLRGREHWAELQPRFVTKPELRRLLAHFVPTWGATHPRSIWLCHVAQLACVPARALDRGVGARAVLLAEAFAVSKGSVSTVSRATPSRTDTDTSAMAASSSGATARALSLVAADLVVRDELRNPDGRSGSVEGSPTRGPEPVLQTEPELELARTYPLEAVSQTTDFGGLFFLLNVLTRLQIAPFLSQHPELVDQELPQRLMLRFCDEVLVPADDPVRALLAVGPINSAPVEFVVPMAWVPKLFALERVQIRRLVTNPKSQVALCEENMPLALWRDAAPSDLWGLGFEPVNCSPLVELRSEFEVLLDAWGRAVSRWLERYARVNVANVVRRPARIMTTRTHMDVVFDLEYSDVAIRRAALDVNPGYLPWFAKVVSYYYVEGEHGG